MKHYFSSFKSRALSYLAIALTFITISLSAEECCCDCCRVTISQCVNAQVNKGTVQQAEKDVESENESSVSNERDSFGTHLKASFSDPINPFEGPLYMLGSPLLGFFGPCLTNAFHDNSFWECVYNHVVGTPCGTLFVFSLGALKTMTLGKFSNGRIFSPVMHFIMID